MAEPGSGATRAGGDDELDDPGRDPVGLNPPRNVLFGDTGSGSPRPTGDVGPADKPEPPTAESGEGLETD
jgi:hypothetical protein